MDMCMPVLGGVEATRELRSLGCAVPIVAMTANASERDRVECIAAGMDGFLSKPVLKEQLTVAIREATQARRRL
jgi:CheY-like chemotaxis protein